MAGMPPLWLIGVAVGFLTGIALSAYLFYSRDMFIRSDMKTRIGTALVLIPCVLLGLGLGAALQLAWR
jgi:hypothetical protein